MKKNNAPRVESQSSMEKDELQRSAVYPPIKAFLWLALGLVSMGVLILVFMRSLERSPDFEVPPRSGLSSGQIEETRKENTDVTDSF